MTGTALPVLERELVPDAASGGSSYLLVCADGTPLRLSPSAANLVRAVAAGISFGELAARVGERVGRPISAAALAASYRRVVERVEAIEARPPGSRLPGGFWLRFQLLSAMRVRILAGRLAVFFHPHVAAALGVVILGALAAWALAPPAERPQGAGYAAAYALFLLSLLVHELGHAAACARFGARPREIGLAVYLIYPAFYSDVTAAWALSRRRRMVVDLGGVFFQLALGALYQAGYLATGWRPLGLAFVGILYSSLFSLNPIFKLDGYWLLADLLGVENLHRQATRLLRHLAALFAGRSVAPLPWSRWVVTALAVYAPLCFGVWALFLCRLVPHAGGQLLALPQQLASAADALAAGQGLVSAVLAIVGPCFLLLVSLLVLWRLATAALVPIGRRLRRQAA